MRGILMTLREEFKKMMSNYHQVYIFGTGDVADRLYELIKEYDGNDNRVIGFIVSEARFCKQDKPKNVIIAGNVLDLSIPVLVTVNRVYHPDIFNLLKKMGSKAIEVHKFFMLELSNKDEISEDNLLCASEGDNSTLTECELACRAKLLELYSKNCQAFGDNRFYQSFPRLQIKGERPTDVRLEKYGLKEYLSKEVDVLDIGANDGFIDMEISSKVRSVLGIEYNEKLVEIACTAREILKLDNVNFICDDYNHWKIGNQNKYDIIFSFAIHIWIGTSPKEYANDIFQLLNDNGIFFFESQTLENDVKYIDYCCAFENLGLEKVTEDYIMDDGKINRKFTIYRKIG